MTVHPALCHSSDVGTLKVPKKLSDIIDQRISGFWSAEITSAPHDPANAIVTALRSAYLQGFADAMEKNP